MGLSNSSQSRKTYVSIVGGRFAIKAKEGDEGAVSRKNKNGDLVWEKVYDTLTGIISSVSVEKNDFLKAFQYVVEINDVGDVYTVNIPVESRYGDSFAAKLPNLEQDGLYTLFPYEYQADGKKNIGIAIYEGPEVVKGQGIKPYNTKDTPNGMPVPKRQLEDDEYKAYKIAQRKFFRDQVGSWGAKPVDTSNVKQAEEDDLPF